MTRGYGKSKLVAELVSACKTTVTMLAGRLQAEAAVAVGNHLTATNLFLCISPRGYWSINLVSMST
jgi:hypothetical protein